MTVGSGVIAWAGDLLEADNIPGVGAKVYDSMAPEDDARPYIILSQQSNTGEGTNAKGQFGANRIILRVKGITEASGYAQAEAIYARIMAVLHGASGIANGVNILSCIWQQEVRYPEIDSGIRYNHLGGDFLIFASAA